MKELSCLFSTVEIFRKRLSRQLPSQHISLLLLIAARPGITQSDLGEILGMPQGTVSRNVKLLSSYFERDQGRGTVKGYDLLFTRPLEDGAYPLGVYLTNKGEDLIIDIVEEMRSSSGNLALAC